jgi:hypothetical protein
MRYRCQHTEYQVSGRPVKISVKKEHASSIPIGITDGAFVFRHKAGVDVYVPRFETDTSEEMSEEASLALLFAWLMHRPDILNELQERQISEIEQCKPVDALLSREIRAILKALRTVCETNEIWITTRSRLSHFRPPEMPAGEYQGRLAVALEVPINLGNQQDDLIVSLARRLKEMT